MGLLCFCPRNKRSSSHSLAGANPPELKKGARFLCCGECAHYQKGVLGVFFGFLLPRPLRVVPKIPPEEPRVLVVLGWGGETPGESTSLM